MESEPGAEGMWITDWQRDDGRRLALHFAARFVDGCGENTDPYDQMTLLRFTGGAWSGKTRLLRGMAEEVELRHPGVGVRFIPGPELIRMLVESLRTDAGTGIRRTLRSADVLVIDDLDCDPSRPATWDALQLALADCWRNETRIVSAGQRSLADQWFDVPTGWFHVPLESASASATAMV